MRRIELLEGRMQWHDMEHGLRLYFRKTRLRWKLTAAGLLLVALCCLGLGRLTSPLAWDALFGGFLTAATTFTICYFFSFHYRLPKDTMKKLEQLGEMSTVLDERGILEMVENAQYFHAWEAVENYQEDGEGLIINFIGGQFKYIPKRLLKVEEEAELKARLAQVAEGSHARG
jgi:hypothetical protein